MCFGHYAIPDLCAPSDYSKFTLQVMELTDTSTSTLSSSDNLEAVADALFPFPLKYHLVWSSKLGEVPLYAWRPVPPSDEYVAMGCVVTTSSEEPDMELVRCVPLRWVAASKKAPKQLWDDSGSGGKPGSVWLINELNMMQVKV